MGGDIMLNPTTKSETLNPTTNQNLVSLDFGLSADQLGGHIANSIVAPCEGGSEGDMG
jgi:hypothetical protein